MQYLGHLYTTKLFITYLKLKFNWEAYIQSGNPNMSHIIYYITIALCYLYLLRNCKFLMAETMSPFFYIVTLPFLGSARQLKILDKRMK